MNIMIVQRDKLSEARLPEHQLPLSLLADYIVQPLCLSFLICEKDGVIKLIHRDVVRIK